MLKQARCLSMWWPFLFFFCGCSSISKLPPESAYRRRIIDVSERAEYSYSSFYSSHDGTINCFEENDGDKEVITVWGDLWEEQDRFVVDYFYKKSLRSNIMIRKGAQVQKMKREYVRDEAEFRLEVAGCFIESPFQKKAYDKIFEALHGKVNYYRSFRVAD